MCNVHAYSIYGSAAFNACTAFLAVGRSCTYCGIHLAGALGFAVCRCGAYCGIKCALVLNRALFALVII